MGMFSISTVIKQNSFCSYLGHGSAKLTVLLCHFLLPLALKISGITNLYRWMSKSVALSQKKVRNSFHMDTLDLLSGSVSMEHADI